MNRIFTLVILAAAAAAGSTPSDQSARVHGDLVVAEMRIGTPHICRLKPGANEVQRIDLPPADDRGAVAFGTGRPRWSPDGSKVAFELDGDEGAVDIAIVNADGTGWRKVTNDGGAAGPTWSPDGKRLAFTSGRTWQTAIYTVDLATNQTKAVVDTPQTDRGPEWSPDGTKIIFGSGLLSRRTSKEDIYVVELSSGHFRPLIEMKGRDAYPRYSPDGKHIAWTHTVGPKNEQIFICDATGMNPRQLTHEGRNWDAAWSPDGKWIYHTNYKSSRFGIARTNVESGASEIVYVAKSRVEAPDVRPTAQRSLP